jgi:hypothetical protein
LADDRRKHPRVTHLFVGQWHAASGAAQVRVADLSVGGCFVQSLAQPAKGEMTSVTVTVGEREFTFSGRVVYIEPGMGFSMKFGPMPASEAAELTGLLHDVYKTK